MIKPINSPVLSSAKPRCGLQKVSDLIPRLIRQYEIQAEITRARQEEAEAKEAAMVDAAMLRQAKAALFEGDTEAWMQEPIGMPAIGRSDSSDPSAPIADAVQLVKSFVSPNVSKVLTTSATDLERATHQKTVKLPAKVSSLQCEIGTSPCSQRFFPKSVLLVQAALSRPANSKG